MNELLQKLLFFGMTKEQAKGAMVVTYRFALLFAVGAGWGWFTGLGVPRFVMASEMKESQSEVIQNLDKQAKKLDSALELLNETLARNVASHIRASALKRCNAKTSVDKEEFNREIDRLQREFAQYSGHTYLIPDCASL